MPRKMPGGKHMMDGKMMDGMGGGMGKGMATYQNPAASHAKPKSPLSKKEQNALLNPPRRKK